MSIFIIQAILVLTIHLNDKMNISQLKTVMYIESRTKKSVNSNSQLEQKSVNSNSQLEQCLRM